MAIADGGSTGHAVCLVTGANRGIGREVCRQLARLGHTVVLTARAPGAAEAAARRVEAEAGRGTDKSAGVGKDADAGKLIPLRLDVADDDSVAEAATRLGELTGGRLDVLVNNAAIGYDSGRLASRADL